MNRSQALHFYVANWRLLLRGLVLGRRAHISYGVHTYGAPIVRWWGEDAGLTIGKYCSIARGVTIFLGGNHRTDWVTTYPFNVFHHWSANSKRDGHPWTRGDVVIGNDVWLGDGSTILSGVRIGDGAVVGARAVVVKHVPPYAIVAGNPARIVRYRFERTQIEALSALKWWDWPESKIRENMDALLGTDPNALI
jgi:acetyltransferase-like isoleucine patch superfamily enzyme